MNNLKNREESITEGAQTVINNYISLPFDTKPNCPYFNNRRKKTRAGLRVLSGKGKPKEIIDEAEIYGTLEKVNLKKLSTDKLKEFLTDHDLGIDCSGFAYHVLNQFLSDKNESSLSSSIKTLRKSFFGKIIAKLRPAENIGVATFNDDKNSFEIKTEEAKPGDMIIFMGTGKDKTYNHILVITDVKVKSESIIINYAHSYAWPSDGKYGHGVRVGEIITHDNNLLAGIWKENGFTGENNYTFESAKSAKNLYLKRLKILGK